MLRDRHYLPAPLRPLVAGAEGLIEQVLGRAFSAICAATPVIAARLANARLTVVQNFPTDKELGEATTEAYGSRRHDLVYVGSITEVRGIREEFAALEIVNARRPTRLQLVGSVAPATLLDELKRHPAWRYVDYHGQLGRAESQAMMRECRVGLVILRPAANYLDSYPTKMFEYLAAGTPVLASNFALWRSIVDRSHCGEVVDRSARDRRSRAATPGLAGSRGRHGRARARDGAQGFSLAQRRAQAAESVRAALARDALGLDCRRRDAGGKRERNAEVPPDEPGHVGTGEAQRQRCAGGRASDPEDGYESGGGRDGRHQGQGRLQRVLFW